MHPKTSDRGAGPESTIGVPDRAALRPGDEAPPGAPGTGENICPECKGSGRIQGARCRNCGGSGKVVTGIAGG